MSIFSLIFGSDKVLIYEQKGPPHIFVFASNKLTRHDLIKSCMLQVLQKIDNNFIVKRFRRILLFFIDEPSLLSVDKVGAYVKPSNIEEGKNTLTIYWSAAMDSFYGTDPSKVVDAYAGVLIHELTHLTHLRTNRLLETTNNNKDRLKDAIRIMGRSLKSNDEFRLEKWLDLRFNLLETIKKIIAEGMADFYSYLFTGKIECSEKSLSDTYAQAITATERMNQDFDMAYSKFLEFLKKNIEVQQLYSRHESYDEAFDHSLKLSGEIDSIFSKAYSHYYAIGLHIYHLLWMSLEDIDDESLLKMDYVQVIKNYESSCARRGWKPVISFREGLGYFSIDKREKYLTTIRKNNVLLNKQ